MKKYLLIISTCLTLSACNSFNDFEGVKEIAPISVDVALDFKTEQVTEIKDLTVKFDNYDEDLHYEKPVSGHQVEMNDILPGIYTVNVSGTGIDADGNEYYLNGSVVNHAIFQEGSSLSLTIKGLKISPLVFKEIYYACSRTPLNKPYIYEQFYEVYNNSSSMLYLDGIHFANLYPDKSSTNLPLWPEEDGDNYVYALRVWKFPGNGTDYPLQPGESCVIAQFAVNHQLEIYNPASPVDNSSADFEFYMDNTNYTNAPAPDMEHIFYNGKAEKGTLKQYLTTVFGGAYVAFQIPEGETWDPVNDPNMQTRDLSTTKATLYAKIPIRYVLDAVEAIDNESKTNSKRLPSVLDAGITWVGTTYNGLGVCRKPSLDDNGNPIQRENGAYIYQDTNNSSDDFERGVTPVLRRNNAGMPEWNHTLKK